VFSAALDAVGKAYPGQIPLSDRRIVYALLDPEKSDR
jgi:hypothetical protein